MSVCAAGRPSDGLAHGDRRAVARFRADLARYADPDADPLLVAVSGGADSLALLLLAHAAMPERVRAATVDHGLRDEAAAEAAWVAEICRGLGVPHAVLRGAPPSRSGRTANLSARARVLRYGLLEEHRLATGCARIATAHHADDQVETLVMRLNRGTGVAGLAGVREVMAAVVRPLLGWRRAELAAIVVAAGLVPVVDPTNVDDRFDRARLRRSLAGADWLAPGGWARTAAAMAEAEDALSWAARRFGEDRIACGEGRVRLRLAGEPAEIARRLIADCLVRVDAGASPRGGDVARLAARLLSAGGAGRVVRSTLAGVLVTARATGGGVVADFRPAPPRRRVPSRPAGRPDPQ